MSMLRMMRLSLVAGLSLAAAPALAQQKPPPPFSWVVAENGQLPPGAFVAGMENNQPSAACRILVQGFLYAGRVTNGACHAGVAGRDVADKRYEVLVADPRALVWLHSAQIDRLPPGAIAGGVEPGPRLNILCRAQVPTGTLPGRYAGKGCVVANAGGEATLSSFEVAALAQPASRAAPTRSGPKEIDSFNQDAIAAVAAMEVELVAAGVRYDDPLFLQLQRYAAALEDLADWARMKVLHDSGVLSAPGNIPGAPPGPAARAATPFEQSAQQAQTALDQFTAAAAPRGVSVLIAALADSQKRLLASLVASGVAKPLPAKP